MCDLLLKSRCQPSGCGADFYVGPLFPGGVESFEATFQNESPDRALPADVTSTSAINQGQAQLVEWSTLQHFRDYASATNFAYGE